MEAGAGSSPVLIGALGFLFSMQKLFEQAFEMFNDQTSGIAEKGPENQCPLPLPLPFRTDFLIFAAIFRMAKARQMQEALNVSASR